MPLIRISQHRGQWLYRKLLEVKDVRDGTHSSPKYIDNGYPLVTSKNLTDSGLSLNDVSLISESDYNEINKRSKVEVGDILLGMIGTIGKPVLVDSDGFAIKNVGLIKNGGQIQNQFLLQYLKTNLFNKYIQIEMAGNTQKFLGLETLRNTKVPVPSQDEQSAIGSLFRTLDDLLASYKDNLTNYQSFKASMLSKMFPKVGYTAPEIRLDGFEGEWENKILSEVTNITMGQSPKSENYTDNPNDYILVQGNADIKDKQVVPRLWTTEVTKMAEIGDIILTVRAPVGDIGKTDYNVVIGRGVAAIKGNDFIFYTLEKMKMTGFWNKFSTGSTFESISSNDIKEAIIQIPTLEEQKAIGAYFSNLDNLIVAHQEKISQLETLKKKLLQDMFI